MFEVRNEAKTKKYMTILPSFVGFKDFIVSFLTRIWGDVQRKLYNWYVSTGSTSPASFFWRLSYTLNLMVFQQTWRPCARDSKVSHVLRPHHKHQTTFHTNHTSIFEFWGKFPSKPLGLQRKARELPFGVSILYYLHPLEISALLRI